MAERITVIGDGQMGLVLAGLLAEQPDQTADLVLWGPFEENVADIAATRRSDRLPGFVLPTSVRCQSDPAAVMEGAGLILHAIPTQFTRPVWRRLRPHVEGGAVIASVAKGIENQTLLQPTRIMSDVLGEKAENVDFVALSGPTIAAELVRRLPATMVSASSSQEAAERVQDAFSTDWLRIYTHRDLPGVEIAGATKNVIALAAGMIDGLEIGYNAKSALLARGLAEIVRLGVAMGAETETFFGIAGVGDLATTCFSPEGRNRTCGEALGRGESLEAFQTRTDSVIEGVATTRSIVALARQHEVDMPITRAVHAILFEDMSPRAAIERLMSREQKAERVG